MHLEMCIHSNLLWVVFFFLKKKLDGLDEKKFWVILIFFFLFCNHSAYLTLSVGPRSTVVLCVPGISAWGGWELGRSGWGWAWSACLGGGGRGGTCSAHPGSSSLGRAHGAGPDPTESSCRNRVLRGWQYWAEGVSCAVVLLDLVQSLLVQSICLS